jgi:hypothetical protein
MRSYEAPDQKVSSSIRLSIKRKNGNLIETVIARAGQHHHYRWHGRVETIVSMTKNENAIRKPVSKPRRNFEFMNAGISNLNSPPLMDNRFAQSYLFVSREAFWYD